jgi:hypothetical protein
MSGAASEQRPPAAMCSIKQVRLTCTQAAASDRGLAAPRPPLIPGLAQRGRGGLCEAFPLCFGLHLGAPQPNFPRGDSWRGDHGQTDLGAVLVGLTSHA